MNYLIEKVDEMPNCPFHSVPNNILHPEIIEQMKIFGYDEEYCLLSPGGVIYFTGIGEHEYKVVVS